jgi:hypothetical protein
MYVNFEKTSEGYEFGMDGGPRIKARNLEELRRQAAANGVSDELYDAVLLELSKKGTARVYSVIGQFSQL